ncbi:MAG TPA: hypothetical protein PKW95_05960 [bacterium]|nr:hypothetical protein [bacterium]
MARRRTSGSFTRKLLTAVLALVAALAVSEIVVRAFSFDWRYAKKLLYYQNADLDAHEPVDDPELLFRLKPGDYSFETHHVFVNRSRARSPERPPAKPAGAFRVLVYGGSNVYGSLLEDDRTWPAQLEHKLAATHRTPIEVWNFGTSSYVSGQMARLAEITDRALAADVVLLAMTNAGSRAFLMGRPVEPLFAKYPQLWRELVIPSRLHKLPGGLDTTLLRHWRFYRLTMLAATEKVGPARQVDEQRMEDENIDKIRRYIFQAKKYTQVAMFICPAASAEIFKYHHENLDIPVCTLTAAGKPEEYGKLHPPAHVMAWYADELAAWMDRSLHLPD